jgi:hypothetical protein
LPRILPFEVQVYESHWQSQFWKVDGALTAISGSWGAARAVARRATNATKVLISVSSCQVTSRKWIQWLVVPTRFGSGGAEDWL